MDEVDDTSIFKTGPPAVDDLSSGYRTRGRATRAAGYRAAILCVGTFETSTGVSYTAAFKGNPDIGPTSFRGRV